MCMKLHCCRIGHCIPTPHVVFVHGLARLLRELRERYLHAGSPLELPAETRRELRLSKASRITMEQLRELQQLLAQGLREYW